MTGLVGWWPLHRTLGDAVDLSGNGNHGTLNGGITRGVAGKAGLQAYSFDGSDDYVNVGDVSAADFGSSDSFSISFWIKSKEPDTFSGSRIPIAKRDSYNNEQGWMWFFNDSTMYFEVDDGSDEVSASSGWDHNAKGWTHFVGVVDRGNDEIRLYIDGSLQNTDSISAVGSVSSGNPLQFGDSQEGTFHPANVIVNDIRIYNRALTANEAQELYDWGNKDVANPPGSSDSGAVSRWKFNGDVTDSWGSNDGTDNTSAGYVTGVRGTQAKDFDGSGDNVDIGSVNHPAQITVSCWVYFNSLSSSENWINVIDLGYHGNNSYQSAIRIADGDAGFSEDEITAHFGDGSSSYQVSSGKFASTGSWYHFAWTYSSDGSWEWYINGAQVNSGSSGDGGIANGSRNWVMGAAAFDTSKSEHDGYIDDVRLYSRALKPWEVFQLYQWGTKGRDMRRLTVNQR